MFGWKSPHCSHSSRHAVPNVFEHCPQLFRTRQAPIFAQGLALSIAHSCWTRVRKQAVPTAFGTFFEFASSASALREFTFNARKRSPLGRDSWQTHDRGRPQRISVSSPPLGIFLGVWLTPPSALNLCDRRATAAMGGTVRYETLGETGGGDAINSRPPLTNFTFALGYTFSASCKAGRKAFLKSRSAFLL